MIHQCQGHATTRCVTKTAVTSSGPETAFFSARVENAMSCRMSPKWPSCGKIPKTVSQPKALIDGDFQLLFIIRRDDDVTVLVLSARTHGTGSTREWRRRRSVCIETQRSQQRGVHRRQVLCSHLQRVLQVSRVECGWRMAEIFMQIFILDTDATWDHWKRTSKNSRHWFPSWTTSTAELFRPQPPRNWSCSVDACTTSVRSDSSKTRRRSNSSEHIATANPTAVEQIHL